MTTAEEFIVKWYEEAESIARRHAARTPGLDADDLRQELAVYIMENRQRLEGMPSGSVAVILDKQAAFVSREARSEFMYHSGQYLYRPDEVKEALPAFFKYEEWESAPVDVDAHDLRGFEGPTVCADISASWDRLTEVQRDVLRRAFLTGGEVNRGHVSRAISALATVMNENARKEGRV